VAARKARLRRPQSRRHAMPAARCTCCATTKSRRTSGQRPRRTSANQPRCARASVSAGAIDRRSVQAAWLGQRM